MDKMPPRWMYRFDNYEKAMRLLREAIAILGQPTASPEVKKLMEEGLIQRFEYSWELGWKLLKDYLEVRGIVLDSKTPASVIRAAFAAEIITDGDAWMEALEDRNKMAHTYDVKEFERIVVQIEQRHAALLDTLHTTMHTIKEREFSHA